MSQIRKIQMFFHPTSGYDLALNTLKSIGLPIRDKDQPMQPQVAAIHTHPSQGAFASSSQPRSQAQTNAFITAFDHIPPSGQLPQVQSRPTSARPSSLQSHSQERTSGIYAPTYDHVTPSKQSSQGHSHTVSARLASSQSHSQGQNETPYSNVPQSTQRQTPSRPSSASSENNRNRFSTRIPFIQDPRSHLERSTSGRVTAYSTAARPSSSSAIFGSRLNPTVTPSLPPRLMPSPELGSRSSAFDYEARPIGATQRQSESLLTDRATLSRMLPPKRTLLFPEEKEKPLNEDDEATTAGESNAELPKNKKANTKATYQTRSRAKKGKAEAKYSRRKSSLPTPEPSSSAHKAPTKETLLVTLNTRKLPSSSAPSRTSSPMREPAQQVDMSSHSLTFPSSPPVLNARNKHPLTTLESTKTNELQGQAPVKPASSAAQRQRGLFDSVLPKMSPAELLDSVDGWIRKFNNLPAPPQPPQTAKELLAEYAKQSDEARAKAIDNLICEYLEDENFVKLVEDVEGAWRRIGLGF